MTNKSESFFVEFLKTILPYKWWIIFITLLGMMLSAIYLYLKPSIYEAQAIMKVKMENPQRNQEENPLGDIFSSGSENIDQELAILQTFHIHKKVIENMDLEVQYFREENYRKNEIFKKIPVRVTNIKIFDKKIVGKKIFIHPMGENGFMLRIDSKSFKMGFRYGEVIRTKWFSFVVNRERDFKRPIYIKLNGDARNIYEGIVKRNFSASRLNKNAFLIKVVYQDTSPQRAVRYLNNLMNKYIYMSIINKSRQNNKILDFITKQLDSIGEDLKRSENELENFRIKNNVIEPTRQSQSLLDRLSRVEVELSQIRIEKSLIDSIRHSVKNDRNLESITPTLRELGDTSTIRVIENLQNLRRRADELSIEFTPKHPTLKAVNRNIWRAKQTILKNIQRLKKNITQKERSLLKLKKKYERKLRILPTKEKRLIDLQRNHEVSSKMYSYLLERQAENNMRRVATVSDYEIIDPAYSSGIPVKPKKGMNLAINTIFSLVFASLLAYWRSKMADRIQNIKEIPELTNLPIYAELPILENSKFLTQDSSKLLKSFRNLRTKINFNHPKQKGNVILVTSSKSAKDREGKTNIVANLGYIFQKAKYKTLIIDFDLYKPLLHKALRVPLNKGTSDFLAVQDPMAEENYIERLIQRTRHENLDILTAGSIKEDASELILSKRLYFLIKSVKKRYEYIFIDAIPLVLEADVLYLMKHSDTNLITVQIGFTQKSFISSIQKHIGEYKFKNIAIVAITNSET